MKISNVLVIGLSSTLLGLISTPALGYTIDLFEDVQGPFQQTGIGTISDTISAPSNNTIIQLEREFQLEVLSGLPFRTAEAGVLDFSLAQDGSNFVAFTESGNTIFPRVTFTWDGANSDGLGGINLTQFGADAHATIQLGISFLDQAVDLEFELRDTLGNSGTITRTNVSSAGSYSFPYSSISNGSVDFTSIDSIVLRTANEPEGLDFQFGFVKTVPFEFSPTGGIVLCFSFFGFQAIKRKLKSSL